MRCLLGDSFDAIFICVSAATHGTTRDGSLASIIVVAFDRIGSIDQWQNNDNRSDDGQNWENFHLIVPLIFALFPSLYTHTVIIAVSFHFAFSFFLFTNKFIDKKWPHCFCW